MVRRGALGCGEAKPIEDFVRNRATADGIGAYCKPSHNRIGRENRAKLHGSTRHDHLKRRYGIGADKVQELIQRQGGQCPICETRPPEHVDHDHKTGLIRGVLCFACNGGLGNFRDNAEWLERAVACLRKARPNGIYGRPGKVREPAVAYGPHESVPERLAAGGLRG